MLGDKREALLWRGFHNLELSVTLQQCLKSVICVFSYFTVLHTVLHPTKLGSHETCLPIFSLFLFFLINLFFIQILGLFVL